MNRVAAKLEAWHRLVEELEDVRLRLKATPAGPARKRLRAEVRRLKEEGDRALEAVSEAIAGERASVCDDPEDETQLPFGGVDHSRSSWSRRRKTLPH